VKLDVRLEKSPATRLALAGLKALPLAPSASLHKAM
jgi:hypothetical protein